MQTRESSVNYSNYKLIYENNNWYKYDEDVYLDFNYFKLNAVLLHNIKKQIH